MGAGHYWQTRRLWSGCLVTSAVLVSFARIEWCRFDFYLLFVSLCADWEAVVKLSEDFNGADLRNVCTEAGQLHSNLFLSGGWEGALMSFEKLWHSFFGVNLCAQPIWSIWLCRCMIYVYLKLWVQCIDFPFPGLFASCALKTVLSKVSLYAHLWIIHFDLVFITRVLPCVCCRYVCYTCWAWLRDRGGFHEGCAQGFGQQKTGIQTGLQTPLNKKMEP